MRIARYIAGDREAVGIVVDDRVVDVGELGEFGADAIAILEGGPELWRRLERAGAGGAGTPLSSVGLLAPIPRPGKFLAVGMNSTDHVREVETAPRTPEVLNIIRASKLVGEAFPEPRFPVMFNKQTTSITGPADPIWIPHDAPEQVDYEGELVIVIGSRVRRADEKQAGEAIAGWTVTNDVSVRDWQWNTSQMWLGKGFDTHGPIGPWIVTADAFDPAEAVIRTWVNEELRQEGRVADQLLSPTRIVSVISQLCTLEPGDLIATGTPGGVGGATGRYLGAGDRVRVAVSGIGEILNEVVDEPVSGTARGADAAAA